MPGPLLAAGPGRLKFEGTAVARKKAVPPAPAAADDAGARQKAGELLDGVTKQLFPDLAASSAASPAAVRVSRSTWTRRPASGEGTGGPPGRQVPAA